MKIWFELNALAPLVCSGSYNKVPEMNSRHFFLTVEGAGKLRARCQTVFWAADCHLLTVSSHSGKGELTHWGLFYQGTNLIHEAPTHNLIISQRFYLPTPSPCGLGSQHVNLGVIQAIIAMTKFRTKCYGEVKH